MNRLQKIKAKQEIYPVGGDEWGRGVNEDDVDWLIKQVDKTRQYKNALEEISDILDGQNVTPLVERFAHVLANSGIYDNED